MGAYKVFIESVVVETSKGLIRLEIERASAFLIVERDWRATNVPLTPTIFPNTSNQNFEIAILFNVVESSGSYVIEDDNHPHSP
jgi:hypothetical protein